MVLVPVTLMTRVFAAVVHAVVNNRMPMMNSVKSMFKLIDPPVVCDWRVMGDYISCFDCEMSCSLAWGGVLVLILYSKVL